MKNNIISILVVYLSIVTLITIFSCKKAEVENKKINILTEAENNNNEKIKKLYFKDAEDIDFNAQRKHDSQTALHIAVRKNNIDLIKFLIKRGVSLNIVDKNNKNSFDYAIEKGNENILKILSDSFNLDTIFIKTNDKIGKIIINKIQNDNKNKLTYQHILDIWLLNEIGYGLALVENIDFKKVDFLLSLGANINGVGDHFDRSTGIHPLYLAVENENIELLKYLINKGAWINIHFDDEPGDTLAGVTPLMRAIKLHYNEIAILLINNGANINLGIDDNTPLSYSIFYKNKEIEKILIDNGAIK